MSLFENIFGPDPFSVQATSQGTSITNNNGHVVIVGKLKTLMLDCPGVTTIKINGRIVDVRPLPKDGTDDSHNNPAGGKKE